MRTTRTPDLVRGMAMRFAWKDTPAGSGGPHQPASAEGEATDPQAALLQETDFKWLMAGHGWWVDTTRLHQEPAYAAACLSLARSSTSAALRQCATKLQAQIAGQPAGMPRALAT